MFGSNTTVFDKLLGIRFYVVAVLQAIPSVIGSAAFSARVSLTSACVCSLSFRVGHENVRTFHCVRGYSIRQKPYSLPAYRVNCFRSSREVSIPKTHA